MLEDPYSEPLVQSISFFGGPYLVSGGTGEHAIADIELLIEAVFSNDQLPESLHSVTRQLVRGLLIVSDLVLRRAGLGRGTPPAGSPGSPVDVPGAKRLEGLVDATFLSHADLLAHGEWLRMVVDTFAIDPGALNRPCSTDYTDDRLHVTPFLRLKGGYRVILPLDLAITIRFHLLRFAQQENQLAVLGEGLREGALKRFMRSLPSKTDLVELERTSVATRYLIHIDHKRDIHLLVATDPLVDWESEVWGVYDTGKVLGELAMMMAPDERTLFSKAPELVHVVITDSPGRAAFWGTPNVDGADPTLMARSDDLDVILHHERDAALGLFLFAQALDRRPGESMSTDVLDEYATYLDHQRSFYLSDERPPHFTIFQVGDGLDSRLRFSAETDRHGVAPPGSTSIVQVQRRYARDTPEIFITVPNRAYAGYVVEVDDYSYFLRVDPDAQFVGPELELLDCIAFWIREVAVLTELVPKTGRNELLIALSDVESWTNAIDSPLGELPIRVDLREQGARFELTGTFALGLREKTNRMERELVAEILRSLFEVEESDINVELDLVAPTGPKRMVTIFTQEESPDLLALSLPRALVGHEQVEAQLLDDLGAWMRSPQGGRREIGQIPPAGRVGALNQAVAHLFDRLEDSVRDYEPSKFLDFLIAQNESLVHHSRMNTMMLPSRLACFGEHSDTVAELVDDRKRASAAHRANRFLIEYVAAQPPSGSDEMGVLDYYRILGLAKEIIDRATTSDLIKYNLADFEISILGSGRLGTSRHERITDAMDTFAASAGSRSVRNARQTGLEAAATGSGGADIIAESAEAMRAEFGFTLAELREVCGGLLDLGEADRVTRIDRAAAVSEIAKRRDLSTQVASAVLAEITLTSRETFLEIGPDAWPWRFNRNMSYVRRPLVLQGDELVFGFRSVYRLGLYWIDGLLSGRLQARARTLAMQRFISFVRGKINAEFADSVGRRLEQLGLTARVGVKKVGKKRIVDERGRDLGDIDVLAVDRRNRTILGIEAKDFEVARTPGEISNEVKKLFIGGDKKPTVELHSARIDWLRRHVKDVLAMMDIDDASSRWQVHGLIVTSEPLLSPLVAQSPFRVLPFDDIGDQSFR